MSFNQGGENIADHNSNTIWASMRDNFTLDHETSRSEVNAQIATLQKNQHALYKTLESARPYISYVYEQTQKRGLPAELALLPIVESEFDPTARSKAGASGLWQIMPATATDLGLTKNNSYDGRHDVFASTEAALNYLNYLYKSFKDDWLLAMAAYNTGPGNVQNAVAKHGKQWLANNKFWDLRLAQETKKYVPKLLALSAVIKDPARYNIKLPPISNLPHVAQVQVGAKVDLKKVAQSTGISVEMMQKLNPGYHKMATAQGAPNTLLVPIEKADAIKPAGPVVASAPPTITPVNKRIARSTDANVQKNNVILASAVPTAPAPTQNVIAQLSIPTTTSPSSGDEDKKLTTNPLIGTILKQGQWLILGLAKMPNAEQHITQI